MHHSTTNRRKSMDTNDQIDVKALVKTIRKATRKNDVVLGVRDRAETYLTDLGLVLRDGELKLDKAYPQPELTAGQLDSVLRDAEREYGYHNDARNLIRDLRSTFLPGY